MESQQEPDSTGSSKKINKKTTPKNKLLVVGAIVVVIGLIVGLALMVGNGINKRVDTSLPRVVQVTITDKGFVPANLVVPKGATVTWTNQDKADHRIASNPHPTHTDLKGLYSPILKQNDTYSFTYDKAGTFGYHDNLEPSTNGSIEVKEK